MTGASLSLPWGTVVTLEQVSVTVLFSCPSHKEAFLSFLSFSFFKELLSHTQISRTMPQLPSSAGLAKIKARITSPVISSSQRRHVCSGQSPFDGMVQMLTATGVSEKGRLTRDAKSSWRALTLDPSQV